jgi:hypothetical protein
VRIPLKEPDVFFIVVPSFVPLHPVVLVSYGKSVTQVPDVQVERSSVVNSLCVGTCQPAGQIPLAPTVVVPAIV